jgi:ADP-ribose pyrophosphatase
MEPWKLLSEGPGPGRYVTVRTREYMLPDGTRVERTVQVGRDSVAVVAITSENEVVLARQFRPGPGRMLDELPGGAIEEGEDPVEAAGRELVEETGYAGEIEIVAATWASGGATRRRWAAVATGCEQVSAPTPDDGEYCEPFLMSVSDFRDHLRSGQLTDVDIGYLGLDHCQLL